jgi:HK97 family phage prohead protease
MATTSHKCDYLAPKDFARELGLHVSAVYRAIERGDLPAVRLNDRGSIRIPRRALEPKAEVLRAVTPAYHLPRGPRPKSPAWWFGSDDDYIDWKEDKRYLTRAVDEFRYEETARGGQLLEGRAVPFDEWTEIRSPSEGHFLERFQYGAFADEIENGAVDRVKVLYQHGEDRMIGHAPIARLVSLKERSDGAYFRAELLAGLPPYIVSGLKRGLYGSSIRFGPIKTETTRSPGRSRWNPTALPERTILKARVKELSAVTWPAYPGASVALSDEIA